MNEDFITLYKVWYFTSKIIPYFTAEPTDAQDT